MQRLYEDNISGKISDERFAKLSETYEAEQKQLILRIARPLQTATAKASMLSPTAIRNNSIRLMSTLLRQRLSRYRKTRLSTWNRKDFRQVSSSIPGQGRCPSMLTMDLPEEAGS